MSLITSWLNKDCVCGKYRRGRAENLCQFLDHFLGNKVTETEENDIMETDSQAAILLLSLYLWLCMETVVGPKSQLIFSCSNIYYLTDIYIYKVAVCFRMCVCVFVTISVNGR